MAREFASEDTSAEPVITDDSAVDTSAETATEATEASTEATEPTTEAPAEAVEEVDYEKLLGDFKAVVIGATQADEAEGRDPDTGTLAAVLLEKVKAAYAPLNGRTRTVARDWIQSEMSDAMTGSGRFEETAFTVARSLIDMLTAVKQGAPKPTVHREPVDPTVAHVARIAALILSPNLVPVPEGVAADWQTQASQKAGSLQSEVIAYRDWQAKNLGLPEEERAEAPKVDDIVLQAVGIARGRQTAGRKASTKAAGGTKSPRQPSANSGVRRDIAAHIREAFAAHPSGHFMSIGEICKFSSSEYGSDSPSQGAVAARLFPGKQPVTLEAAGVKAEVRDSKGAVKL